MNMILKTIKRAAFMLMLFGVAAAGGASAADLPTASSSPLARIQFSDAPLVLPVQRNFQMAMLTAGSELGRSCGTLESYGWRLDRQEQGRVNQIFNNAVDQIRAQGFTVETQQVSAVSEDVTLFTADRADRHMLFLWSAGDIGLVLVLCETSAPISPTPIMARTTRAKEIYPASYPMPQTIAPETSLSSRIAAGSNRPPRQLTRTGEVRHDDFSPQGRWVGSYTCVQGTMGAVLDIASLQGEHFEGTFRFYPTAKNPYVAKGKYKVFGEYDSESQRLLINPGEWIDRPKGYYNTIMIGSFDPVAKSLSAFFQGITGCTSFEGRYDGVKAEAEEPVAKKAVKKTPSKKKKVAKKNVSAKKSVKEKAQTSSTKGAKKAAKSVTKKSVAPSSVPAAAITPATEFEKEADSLLETAPATNSDKAPVKLLPPEPEVSSDGILLK
ncbi:MAG: hypothetical protein AB7S81_03870 [Bdellovibrionales bacterium]